MPSSSQQAGEPSLAALLAGIITDAKDLMLQEFTMAKLEIKDELRKTKAAAISFGIGIGVAGIGAILLVLMSVHLLQVITELPLWACYGIVGGVFVLVGVVFLVAGKKTAEDIEVVPPRTVETIKENAKWIKEQTTSNGV
jgi:hypothetical protein